MFSSKPNAILFFCLAIILFSACKQEYLFEYRIGNATGKQIIVSFIIPGKAEVSKSVIGPGHAIVLGRVQEFAKNPEELRDQLTLPFSQLEVSDLDGNKAEICPADWGPCWHGPRTISKKRKRIEIPNAIYPKSFTSKE